MNSGWLQHLSIAKAVQATADYNGQKQEGLALWSRPPQRGTTVRCQGHLRPALKTPQLIKGLAEKIEITEGRAWGPARIR